MMGPRYKIRVYGHRNHARNGSGKYVPIFYTEEVDGFTLLSQAAEIISPRTLYDLISNKNRHKHARYDVVMLVDVPGYDCPVFLYGSDVAPIVADGFTGGYRLPYDFNEWQSRAALVLAPSDEGFVLHDERIYNPLVFGLRDVRAVDVIFLN